MTTYSEIPQIRKQLKGFDPSRDWARSRAQGPLCSFLEISQGTFAFSSEIPSLTREGQLQKPDDNYDNEQGVVDRRSSSAGLEEPPPATQKEQRRLVKENSEEGG